MTRTMRLKQLLTAQYTANKQTATKCQAFTTLFYERATQKEKNTREPSLAVIHLRKLINTFHKEYLEKPTVTSLLLNSVPLMVKSTVSKEPKQKRGRSSKGVNKRRKNKSVALKPLR